MMSSIKIQEEYSNWSSVIANSTIRKVVCVKVQINPGQPNRVPELGIDKYS